VSPSTTFGIGSLNASKGICRESCPELDKGSVEGFVVRLLNDSEIIRIAILKQASGKRIFNKGIHYE